MTRNPLGQVNRRHQLEMNKRDSLPVIADLAQAGFDVEWISDLYVKKMDYKSAIPVLLNWLSKIENLDVKESIVRALSVAWAKPTAALPLINEFKKANPESVNFKWAIANALSVVADDSVYTEIADLIRDTKHGKAREMLALALGNMQNSQAPELLIELLKDDVVAGHAIMALGKLKAKKASPAIEQFLAHPKAWIRKEAKKALSRIDKGRDRTDT